MVIIKTTDNKFGKVMEGLSKMEEVMHCVKELLGTGYMAEREYEDYDEYEDDDMSEKERMHKMMMMNHRRGGGGRSSGGRYRM